MLAAGLQVSQINKHLIRRETEMKSKSRKSINILLLASVRLLLSQPSVNLLTPPPPLLRSISGQLISFPQRREERGEEWEPLVVTRLGVGLAGREREGRPVSQPVFVIEISQTRSGTVNSGGQWTLFMFSQPALTREPRPNMHECINIVKRIC